MSTLPLSNSKPEKKPRISKTVALAILSPAVLALSGCNSNCDNNRSTPQTSDDCGVGRSSNSYRGGGAGGFVSGTGRNSSGTTRGGFGGFGRSFSGGG